LSEIYGVEPAARAIDDALEFEAFSCEYIANLLEQRRRVLPELGALHVTRRQDLLELELPEPDMSVYGGASAPPVPPAPSTVEGPALSTVEGSNVEGGQGHVPDEVAKQQQPTQMTLDF